MTVARSALFAAAVATAAFGCHRRHQRNPEPALDLETSKPDRTVEQTPPSQSEGFGTAAPNGGGALGGAVVSSAQGRTKIIQMRSRAKHHYNDTSQNHVEETAPGDQPTQGIGDGDTYERNR
ncbi:MAG TPA: hypothetical protein VFV99_06655 [Kofleriaceae bacterium]|nr:hypothetical protein [Kofleriaceae bacterium]